MKIAPSILSADFGQLADQIAVVADAGADWIHVDVMDGHFVPNITIGPLIARAAKAATDLPIDVHLMIENPDRYLADFVDAGADYLTVHLEACPHVHRTVQAIRELGARPGVAINPGTPVEALVDIAPYLDLVLVMSVNPGFGGQAYIPTSTEKVRRTVRMLAAVGGDAEIEVDGGVDSGNVASLRDAGATAVVAGSAVYRHPEGPAAGVQAIRDAIHA